MDLNNGASTLPSAAEAITVLTAMPRIVSVLGYDLNLGLSTRDRLHKRCRVAALDFKGCLESGILTKERAETILLKMDAYVLQHLSHQVIA